MDGAAEVLADHAKKAGRPPSTISAAFDAVISSLNAIGTIWVFVIMVALNADVIGRYFFNAPIRGVPLLIELSVVALIFLQLPATLRDRRLTRSDVFIGRMLASRPAAGHALQGYFNLMGAALMATLFISGLPLFEQAWKEQTYVGAEGDFTLPIWPLKLIILIGSAACLLLFIRFAVRDVHAVRARVRHEARLPFWLVVCSVPLAFAAFLLLGDMLSLKPAELGLLSILYVVVMIYAGVHIGVALAFLSFFCVWFIRGDPKIAGAMISLAAGQSLQRYEFGVIPLFVLMGIFLSISNVGRDAYDVANYLFRRVRAGLGMATVAANTVFAAVTGTSIASASVFSKVAVPEMLRHGYQPRFTVGVVGGSSVLGMLIPPSLLLIIYGILAETSISKLFIAGIVPGLLLATAYCVYIYVLSYVAPGQVAIPSALTTAVEAHLTRREAILKSIPIISIIGAVFGGIYGGIFTATEAGGVGALCGLFLTILRRRLTWQGLWYALAETGRTTATICFLLFAGNVYSRMLALTGIPNVLESILIGMGFTVAALLTVYIILIIVMGTLLEAGAIMLIMVPLMIPLLQPHDVDLFWFGIVTVIGVEIGLLTPPVGLSCIVIHSNLDDSNISLRDIYIGVTPFAVIMVLVLILIVLLPEIATVLL